MITIRKQNGGVSLFSSSVIPAQAGIQCYADAMMNQSCWIPDRTIRG
jgi:hypothetical protein